MAAKAPASPAAAGKMVCMQPPSEVEVLTEAVAVAASTDAEDCKSEARDTRDETSEDKDCNAEPVAVAVTDVSDEYWDPRELNSVAIEACVFVVGLILEVTSS